MSIATSRRTALALLGFAPAGALAAEDISERQPTAKGFRFGVDKQRAIAALRRLADDLEAGGSLLFAMELGASLKHDAFLTHRFTVEFAISQDDKDDEPARDRS